MVGVPAESSPGPKRVFGIVLRIGDSLVDRINS